MASIGYLVSSLKPLAFDGKPPYSVSEFLALAGGGVRLPAAWTDLETQLRNVIADARGGGGRCSRPADGVSLFWRNRMAEAMRTKGVAERERAVAKVWWDAAGELTPVASPLSEGALATYFLRLKIVSARSRADAAKGGEVFGRLVSEAEGK